MKRVASVAVTKEVRVFALSVDEADFRVKSTDISNLDASSSDDTESGWGGLTSFSTNIGQAVAKSVNEAASSK